jgi:hypothetical protein
MRRRFICQRGAALEGADPHVIVPRSASIVTRAYAKATKVYTAGKIAAKTSAVAAVIETSLAIFLSSFIFVVRRRRHERQIWNSLGNGTACASLSPQKRHFSSNGRQWSARRLSLQSARRSRPREERPYGALRSTWIASNCGAFSPRPSRRAFGPPQDEAKGRREGRRSRSIATWIRVR